MKQISLPITASIHHNAILPQDIQRLKVNIKQKIQTLFIFSRGHCYNSTNKNVMSFVFGQRPTTKYNQKTTKTRWKSQCRVVIIFVTEYIQPHCDEWKHFLQQYSSSVHFQSDHQMILSYSRWPEDSDQLCLKKHIAFGHIGDGNNPAYV